MYVKALVLSERTWYDLQPSVFRCTGVVGGIDEMECSGIQLLATTPSDTDVVGRISGVESTGLDFLILLVYALFKTAAVKGRGVDSTMISLLG